MRIFWIVTALPILLVLDNAKGKSVSSFADGELVIMPKRENDGELVIMPKKEVDGERVIMPKEQDDGELVIMPKRENDGELVIMPKKEVDGELVIMPKEQDDGELVIMPKRENDGELVIMHKKEVDGELVIMPKRPDDGELVIMPKGADDGELVIMPKREDDGELIIKPKREDDGELVIMPKQYSMGSAKLMSSTCKCGRKNPIVRIVGGVPTTLHEYPWQAGLVSPSGTIPFCGGSIISNQYILTAAHCVEGESPGSFRVVIGEHNTVSATETTETKYIGVQSIKVHPGYNSNTMDNDLALIKLSKPITFPANNKVAPICLPSAGKTFAGFQATVTGWGTTTEGGSVSNILREVTIPVLTRARCRELMGSTTITVNMLCAGPEAGGKDSCQGDSGGPLTTTGGPKYQVLAGIVSWGSGCARPREPGVYTKVNNYLSWINTNIAGSTTCATP